ncbi:hypothetical protein CR513_18594, partial [Mucuna pruriens]
MSKILEMLQSMKNPNENASEQPHVTPIHPLSTIPLYGLPPGNIPPDPHTSTSNPQNQKQPQDPNFKINGTQSFFLPPTHNTPNHQVINPMPTIITHPYQSRDTHSKNRLQLLEERLKTIEGAYYHAFNVANLCLIPNVIIPSKFKLPEFDKYKGNMCPKNHLIIKPYGSYSKLIYELRARMCANMEEVGRGFLKTIQVQYGHDPKPRTTIEHGEEGK